MFSLLSSCQLWDGWKTVLFPTLIKSVVSQQYITSFKTSLAPFLTIRKIPGKRSSTTIRDLRNTQILNLCKTQEHCGRKVSSLASRHRDFAALNPDVAPTVLVCHDGPTALYQKAFFFSFHSIGPFWSSQFGTFAQMYNSTKPGSKSGSENWRQCRSAWHVHCF